MRTLTATCLLAACTLQDPVSVELADHSAWTATPFHDDHLHHHRPNTVVCGAGGWREEAGLLEVQTGYCNYAALRQPLPFPLRAGEALQLVAWHDTLDAPKPAEGHLAFTVGDDVVWETYVPIPSPAQVFEIELSLPRDTHPEDQLGVHLHNHGYNSWTIASVNWTGRLGSRSRP